MSTPITRPLPTTDISGPDDVEEMVRRFYGDVAQDDLLGPLFNTVARVDWSEHIPKLAMFWKRALFGINGYSGNPFHAHKRIHEQDAFGPEHYERWLDLFHETSDLGWFGPVAERAKELGRNVARVHSTQLTGSAVVFQAPRPLVSAPAS